MRKLYQVKTEHLTTALQRLGYQLKSQSGLISEYIRPPFHLYVTLRRGTAVLRLHVDLSHSFPLPHGKIDRGEKIRSEYDAIIKVYTEIKAGK